MAGTRPNTFQALSSATVSPTNLALHLSRRATHRLWRKRPRRNAGQLLNIGVRDKNTSYRFTSSMTSQLVRGTSEGIPVSLVLAPWWLLLVLCGGLWRPSSNVNATNTQSNNATRASTWQPTVTFLCSTMNVIALSCRREPAPSQPC